MTRLERLGWFCISTVLLFAAIGSVALVCAIYDALGADSGKSQAVAAWAQAIGSIAAIVVALYIPARQRIDDRAQRRLEGLERTSASMQVLLWTAREAGMECINARRVAQPSRGGIRVLEFRLHVLEELVARLKRFHESTVDSALQSKCMGLRLTVEALLAFMRMHHGSSLAPGSPASDPLEIAIYTDAVDSIIHDISEYAKSIEAQLTVARQAVSGRH